MDVFRRPGVSPLPDRVRRQHVADSRDTAARYNGKLTVLPGEYVGGGLRVEKAPALVPDHSTTVTVRNNLVTMRAQREKEGSQKGSRGFFPTAAAAQP